jgi:ATP/maltotriose-dependent transcriptional regulator MalT
MSETLLRTKLFAPPRRPNLVSRPHLIKRLNQGLQLGHKLALISAPAGFGKIILVLDDYHLIDAQPVHDALSFLIENIPPQLLLVISSREDPPLPLSRLRARAQLTELRAADLRFSSSEAADFLNQVMGLDLSAKDIVALETRTEGWITGLRWRPLPCKVRF